MSNVLDDNGMGGGAGQRPTFLTVLCILTFIGSGLGILGAVMGFLSPIIMGVTELMINNIISLVAALGTLYGAMQMWKLQKIGFYIYSVCELVPIVTSFLLFGGFGAMSVPGLADMVIMIYFVAIIIPVGFVIMYFLNLKHMS